VQAAWYSPFVGLGRMLATQIVNHKKIALGAGIASALAYLRFIKVREARINRLIECEVRRNAPEIERMVRTGQPALARVARGRTWFKNWQVTISPEVINGMACMEVHGSNGIKKRYGFLGDLRENDYYGEYKVVNGGHFFLI
jgi:hypothetical protein